MLFSLSCYDEQLILPTSAVAVLVLIPLVRLIHKLKVQFKNTDLLV